MASTKSYLDLVLDQLQGLSGVSYRGMMGEYILYMWGRVVGGIYDNRLLIKPTKSALALIENVKYELPYEGARNMLLIEDIDNKDLLSELFLAVYKDLDLSKKKK